MGKLAGGAGYNDARDAGVLAYRDACPKCGAVRVDRQIGLEDTVDGYVGALVDVFRHVRRVLRDDGVLWLNLGDSYWSSSGSTGRNDEGAADLERRAERYGTGVPKAALGFNTRTAVSRSDDVLKPKDLIGVPWRVAFALQADGWWLRKEVIWHKPNAMPESVTDRPASSHEHVFLLTKRDRYFYDAEAVKRPARTGGSRSLRDVWSIATKAVEGNDEHAATMPEALVYPCVQAGSRVGDTVLDPFSGTGTVAVVAKELGRVPLGLELNPGFAEFSRRRLAKTLRRLDV